jgi:ribose transport system substrate-binding protein
MKKKLLACLLVGMLILSLGACGGKDVSDAPKGDSGETAEIAVIFKALNAEYWKTMQAGCEAAAEDLGINVTVLGPNAESEIAQQVTMIEEQLAAGVDAIVVAPCEENAVIGALSPYVGQLPILAVDSDFGLEGKTAFIGTGNQPAAKLGGTFAAEAIGEGGKAILIGGQQGEGTSTARLAGFQEGLEEKNCVVLETQYGKNTADGAMAVMEDMLTKYPGEIGAVLAMNDDMIQGCLQAIQNAGVEGITLVGFNGDAGAVQLIADGKISATVAQQPYEMGYQAVEQAYKAVKGETIEKHQEVAALLITKENAAEFLK